MPTLHAAAAVARPYARAAYEQAQAEGSVQSWARLLEVLAVVAEDHLMAGVLTDPRVSAAQHLDVVQTVCAAWLQSQSQRNFLAELVRAGRLPAAAGIHHAFRRLQARDQGVRHVELTTAYPLEPAEQETLAGLLQRHLGAAVEVEAHVDAGLIGGARVRIGDSVINASIRGRLEQLAEALA